MTMTDEPNCANWQDPGAFDFERLLDFGVKGTEPMTNKPPKPLACLRCHGQKLRCVRRTSDAPVCDRCSSANVECVSRQPQRMGRPADTTTNGRHGAHGAGRTGWRLRSHAESHSGATATPSPTSNGGTKRRRKSPGDPSASSSPTDMAITYDSATTQFELDGWMWPTGPSLSDAAPPALTAGSTAHSSSGSSSSGLAQPSTGFTSYAGSLGSFGSPNALLPSLDDLSNLFPASIDAPCFEPQRTPDTSDGASDGQLSPSDPVEHLSRLHLELYHCLVAVKAVEKMKRDRLRYEPPTKPGGDIDTSWSENLFRTTERFIDALKDYVGPSGSDPCAHSSSGPAPTTVDDTTQSGWEDTDPSNPGPQVDTATGLMIVSCYTRLVQIFDVVVFVVETFQDMDCPGSYVQVRFGDFTPTVNKRFQARALGQYVLHLLEGISEGVDRAVASRQPYARAVAEVRRNEGKLKERILTTLH